MTGNDVYPRTETAQQQPIRLNDLKTNVDKVIGYKWAPARSVLVLGPLPRFKFDAGRYWADSPAFQAQQVTKKVARSTRSSFCHSDGFSLKATGNGISWGRTASSSFMLMVFTYPRLERTRYWSASRRGSSGATEWK